jgi:hypothetical protein
MQAFLIDPYKETISEFNFSGNFEDINKAIESRCFTLVNLDGRHYVREKGNDMFVDDEGLLRGNLSLEKFIKISSYPDPLVGKGLVLGCDDMGESTDTTLTIDELKSMIQFWSIFEVHEHMSRSAA